MNELQNEVEISYADKRQIYDVQVQLCFSCLSFFFSRLKINNNKKAKTKKKQKQQLKNLKTRKSLDI